MLVEAPAVSEQAGGADHEQREDGAHAGFFDGEVAQVLAVGFVDGEVVLVCCAAEVVVEEATVEDCGCCCAAADCSGGGL